MSPGRLGGPWGLLAASIAALVAAVALRLAVGFGLGLSVLVVEGYHALVDLVLSGLMALALALSRSAAGKRYPYGLYKLEDLAAFSLALAILVELAYQVPTLRASPPYLSLTGLVAEAVSVPLLALSALAKRGAAAALRSPALKADTAHMWVDVAESASVSVGLAAYLIAAEPIVYKASLAVALAGLLLAAYEAARDSVLALLDLPVDRDIVGRAWSIARSVAAHGRVEVSSLKLRWAGPAIFVEARLRAHPLAPIEEASKIAGKLEEAFRNALEGVEAVSIVIEPSRRAELLVAVPVEEPSPEASVAKHFGKTRFFLVARVNHGKVEGARVISRPSPAGSHSAEGLLVGADLAEDLHNAGVTDVIVVSIGEIAYALLLRHRILVWKALPDRTAIANVEALVRGELEMLEAPTHEASWRRHL